MKRAWWSLAMLLAVASAARPNQPDGARARIELRTYRHERRVAAVIGGVAATMLFDTGGGLSMISPSLAAKIGCQPWGRLTGFRMTGARLDVQQCSDVEIALGEFKVRAPVIGVLDLSPFMPKDYAPVDGAIALDLFDGQAVTIDLAHDAVIVESAASLASRTRNLREGKLRLERQLQGAALDIHVAATTARGPVWFQLDSGNGGSLLASKPIAALVGLDPNRKTPQPGRLNLVGGVTVDGNFLVPDFILDGNLGMPFLTKWIFTIDFQRARIWYAPAQG
jgi:hypothetical protein